MSDSVNTQGSHQQPDPQPSWATHSRCLLLVPASLPRLSFTAPALALDLLQRDGMNLVSYEYVACQSDNAGVLVLSEFAGEQPHMDSPFTSPSCPAWQILTLTAGQTLLVRLLPTSRHVHLLCFLLTCRRCPVPGCGCDPGQPLEHHGHGTGGSRLAGVPHLSC
jgi:hypothetical protein